MNLKYLLEGAVSINPILFALWIGLMLERKSAAGFPVPPCFGADGSALKGVFAAHGDE